MTILELITMRKYSFTLIGLWVTLAMFGQNQPERRLTDSERLIRIETLLTERFKAIDQRFEAIDQRFKTLEATMNERFDAINKRLDAMDNKIERHKQDFDRQLDRVWTVLLWVAGILFAAMFSIIGLIFWDRRNQLAPLKEKQRVHDLIIEELSTKYPEIRKILTEQD